MDQIDQKILAHLKQNARARASDIGKAVHLSVSTVIERIHKMEDAGIICSYTAITNDAKVGNDVTALIEISLEHPRFNDSFSDQVMRHPNVVSCYYLTGSYDYMIKVSCRSSDELEVIHRWVKDQPGVCQTQTHFVLRTIKNIYSALPSGDASAPE
ncbi:Lrp/AsnC family transcriptional regulator [Butyricicoccus sp.]|uniref:Lrp/AsnC family transcriptional regulator n=1 Tax=Butyricicoccus sp. TaxID=2049021 RepID=UPI003D7F1427